MAGRAARRGQTGRKRVQSCPACSCRATRARRSRLCSSCCACVAVHVLCVVAPFIPRQVKFLVAVLEGVLPKGRVAAAADVELEVESKGEFFEGLGNIPEAPKYLRIKGKVSRGRLLRRRCCNWN